MLCFVHAANGPWRGVRGKRSGAHRKGPSSCCTIQSKTQRTTSVRPPHTPALCRAAESEVSRRWPSDVGTIPGWAEKAEMPSFAHPRRRDCPHKPRTRSQTVVPQGAARPNPSTCVAQRQIETRIHRPYVERRQRLTVLGGVVAWEGSGGYKLRMGAAAWLN